MRHDRSPALLSVVAMTALVMVGCYDEPSRIHWSEGTWQVDMEGWNGALEVKKGGESLWFEARISGPDGQMNWTGSVYPYEFEHAEGLELHFANENGEGLPGRYRVRRSFRRIGDRLSGEIRGTPLTGEGQAIPLRLKMR